MSFPIKGRGCRFSLVFAILCVLFSACSSGGGTLPTETPSMTPTLSGPTATPFPTSTPTPQPLGNADNPVVMGLVSAQTSTQVTDAGNQVAAYLTSQTGYHFRAAIFDTYPALLAAIEAGTVQIAWLPPFTYILANQQNLVEVGMVANHFGVYSYGSMFLANIASGFTPYYDSNTNQNTADANTALQQFDGKRPCFVETESASGYIVPIGILATNKITFQEPVTAQTYGAVIRSLYIQQICDFGATYAISGDPRTASSIQDSFPDVMEKIIVIWRTDPVIPNLSLVFCTGFPKGIRQLVTDALSDWVNTEEGKSVLTAANQYDIEGLKQVDNAYFDPLRSYLKASAINVDDLVGR